MIFEGRIRLASLKYPDLKNRGSNVSWRPLFGSLSPLAIPVFMPSLGWNGASHVYPALMAAVHARMELFPKLPNCITCSASQSHCFHMPNSRAPSECRCSSPVPEAYVAWAL